MSDQEPVVIYAVVDADGYVKATADTYDQLKDRREWCEVAETQLGPHRIVKFIREDAYPSCAEKDAEIEAAQVLCEIYFEIAAAAIGEEQVRCLRDAAMEQRILRGEG